MGSDMEGVEHSLENVPAKQEDEELDQLFGEEEHASGDEAGRNLESVSGSAEEENASSDEQILNRSPRRLRHAPLASKSVEVKAIKKPLDSGYMPYLLKLPGFIQFQPRPSAERGLAAALSEEYPEQEVLDYGDILKAQTTIRAVHGRNDSGAVAFESNSRLNRWSDGSWTLQIGGVHFEVLPQAFTEDEYNFLYVKQQLNFAGGENAALSGEGMEAVAKLANKLTVRPFTDASGSHRKYLALAEATGKGMKVTKVRVATTTVDPEKQKQNLIKLQQERTKARRKVDARRKNQQQRAFEKVGREGLSARFLEENEDGEAFYSGEEGDEYDADFIDDSEIVEGGDSDVDVADSEGEAEEEEKAADTKPLEPVPSQAKTSRTSRLIFDDDDDDQ